MGMGVAVELREIEYFLRVAELGSFSSAAIDIGIAQPALSRRIARLEEEFGARLLNRNGRGVTLTHAGEILQHSGRLLMQEADQLVTNMSETRKTMSGSAVIGLPPTVGRILTVPLARRFRESLPQVQLRIVEGFSGHVMEWLHNGRLDVGIVYTPVHSNTVIAEPLVEEDLMLIGPPDKTLPEGQPIPLAEVARLPLILPGQPHNLRNRVEQIARRMGLRLNIVVEVDSFYNMLETVRNQIGYTILPPASLPLADREGQLATWRITEPDLTQVLHLATARQRADAVGVRELARLVRQEVLAHRNQGLWRAI